MKPTLIVALRLTENQSSQNGSPGLWTGNVQSSINKKKTGLKLDFYLYKKEADKFIAELNAVFQKYGYRAARTSGD